MAGRYLFHVHRTAPAWRLVLGEGAAAPDGYAAQDWTFTRAPAPARRPTPIPTCARSATATAIACSRSARSSTSSPPTSPARETDDSRPYPPRAMFFRRIAQMISRKAASRSR